MSNQNKTKNILITGVGSGLGKALAQTYLENNAHVYAIGRTCPQILKENPYFDFFSYDLSQVSRIKQSILPFIKNKHFDIAILNAGILGEIRTLNHITLCDINKVMEINVWANKELIDLLASKSVTKQIVAISSGASVNGSKGWGAYSLSKASLNMLLKVYAKELPEIHFTSLAPGVIRTAMVEHIIKEVNQRDFPSAKRLKEGYIQTPKEAAQNLLQTFPKLFNYESGSFLDIRTMGEIS